MGGTGKTVEVDETFLGFQEGVTEASATSHRQPIPQYRPVGYRARRFRPSFHISGTTVGTLVPILRTNVRRESVLMTDEANWYRSIGREYENHLSVNHKAHEYAVGEITTNTVEGYFSIFKRGMSGVYQHCSEKHLHRYLSDLISATATALPLALTMQCVPTKHCRVSLESA